MGIIRYEIFPDTLREFLIEEDNKVIEESMGLAALHNLWVSKV